MKRLKIFENIRLAELLTRLPLAVGVVLFSHSTNWLPEEERESLAKTVFLTRIMLLNSIGTAALLAFLAWWIIHLFYGIAFQESAKVVWCLLPGVIALSVFITMRLFIAGQGRPELALYSFGPSLILNIILNVYLIPRWSYLGAAVSSTISYTCATYLFSLLFTKRYKTCFGDIFPTRGVLLNWHKCMKRGGGR